MKYFWFETLLDRFVYQNMSFDFMLVALTSTNQHYTHSAGGYLHNKYIPPVYWQTVYWVSVKHVLWITKRKYNRN